MAPDVFTCTVDSLAYGVFGVARTEDGVVMIPGTAPGDVVRARAVAHHGDYREAEVVEILSPGESRRTPPCPYVAECGGCPWQHVDYPAQLAAKEAALRSALVRGGGFPEGALDVRPIVPSAEWGYRHRLTLRVDGEQRLGFYRHRSHRLVEIDRCLLADDVVNRHLSTARDWLRGTSNRVRRLEIASVPDAAASSVILVANAEGRYRGDDEYHERFLRRQSEVRGIVVFGNGWRHTFGDPRVELDIGGGLRLETSGGFTQVNPEGNRTLVSTVLELAQAEAADRALDLYCGAGNLTAPLAVTVASVVGVEMDPHALNDARKNADRAGLRNCRFIQADAAKAARGLADGGERFDLVVLDPPRSGAAAAVDAVARLEPRRIVYVSCNPTTLARDLRRLAAHRFTLGPVQPIDLFPQSHHLETVAVLDALR